MPARTEPSGLNATGPATQISAFRRLPRIQTSLAITINDGVRIQLVSVAVSQKAYPSPFHTAISAAPR